MWNWRESLRKIEWEDQNSTSPDLSGDAVGWGLNLSTNIKLGKRSIFRGSFLYGKGIENYMNDATIDVGIKTNPGNATRPIEGVALPVMGLSAFIDHNWNERFATSIGYSFVDINNADASANDQFSHGDYAIANLVYTPVPRFMFAAEGQYGKRTNFRDGFSADILKLQFSFKYSFSHMFYKDAK